MKLKEKIIGIIEDVKSWDYFHKESEFNIHKTEQADKCEIIVEDVAVNFTEWKYKNRWFNYEDGKWSYTFEHGTSIGKATYEKNYRKTTKELFELFKKDKGL